ncbi:MAG: hypothetical protein WC325_05710 [Candidatus Bathyarchaeia archaeon]
MSELDKTLVELLKSAGKPISFRDIISSLGETDAVPVSKVRSILKELEETRTIISFKDGPADDATELYRFIDKDILGDSVTRSSFEEQEKQKLLRCLIDDSTGRYSTLPHDEARKMFACAAEKLLHEDPRRLFSRFAKWLQIQHESETRLYKECKNSGRKSEAQDHYAKISRLEECSYSIFSRMLGIPTQIRESSGVLRTGPFILKLNKVTLEDVSCLDNKELEKYLHYGVRGKYVIEKSPIEGRLPPIHIGGSDASIQPISLSSVLPWQVEPSEVNIVTAVGVRYDIYRGVRSFDRRPDPKVLAQYERRQAIEEGLLIPPAGTMGYAREMENRVKEAAMDLRQYTKDFELMFSNEPTVKIHFRDGRVFPLEHRLSDALQMDTHGEIVRSSLKVFRNIVNMIGAEDGDILFCGFVKRPGVSIIAPLIMWYIGFGSANETDSPIDPEMTVEDFLRSPYSDNYAINQIFSAIREKLNKNEAYVTFRLIRRFQSMEEPYVQNFEPTIDRDVWIERLQHYSRENLGGISDDSGAELIAALCARAAVVQFYCSLIGNPDFEANTQIPRIEFLLPHDDLKKALSPNSIESHQEWDYLKRILSSMFYPGVLEPYPDQLFFFTSESPEMFVAPRPVCDAHISSKEIAKIYRDDFIELLLREAREYWRTRAMKFRRNSNQ